MATLTEARPHSDEEVHHLLRTVERIPFTWDGFHPGMVIDATVARLRLVQMVLDDAEQERPPGEELDPFNLDAALAPEGFDAPGLSVPGLEGIGSDPTIAADTPDAPSPQDDEEAARQWRQRAEQRSLQAFLLVTCFDLLGKDDYLHTIDQGTLRDDPERGAPQQEYVARYLQDLSEGMQQKYAITRKVFGRGGIAQGTEDGFHRFFDDILPPERRDHLANEWQLEGVQLQPLGDAEDPLHRVIGFLYLMRAFSNLPPVLGGGGLVDIRDLRPLHDADPFLVEDKGISHPGGGITLRWKGTFAVADREASIIDALRRLVLAGLYGYVAQRAAGAVLSPRLLQPRI